MVSRGASSTQAMPVSGRDEADATDALLGQARQEHGNSDNSEDNSEGHAEEDESEQTPSWMRTTLIALPLLAVVGAIAVVGWAAIENKSAPMDVRFEAAMTQDAVEAHLTQFQLIAKQDPFGSRSILNGYEASAEYVESKINGSGYYNVWRQYFTAMVWTQTVPAFLEVGLDGADGSWVAVSTAIPLADTDDAEACALRYSGITSPDAPLTKSVVFISGGGCDPSNFTDAKGKALLVLSNFSSECNYYQVAWAAEEAGALALLVARSSPGLSLPASRVRDADWTPDSNVVTIPCLGLTFTLGELLRSKPTTAFVRLSVEAVVTYPVTFNIIAETAGHERDDEMVVIGAHLDSVPAGPGINDNGSGSASILEMAIQFAALGIKPKRTTQFAWWGAEEVGLLGSRNYVANLSSTEASNTSAMLNFDMLASPNYVRMVYDGTGCPDESRDTCVLLQSMFTDYFTSQNLKYEVVPFSTTGGSDYFPFIRANIPAGSIATGAGSLKTDAQRTSYGGLTKAAFDPCYHQSCDTTENIDSTVYAQMTQAAAHVTINTVNYAGDLR